MKKALFTLIMLLTISLAFCEVVTLIDQTVLEGQITGKRGDILYLQVNSETYSINKNDIDKITNGGSTIKNLIFAKKDWGIETGAPYQLKTMTVDTNEPVIRPDEKERDLDDVKLEVYKEIGKKPIDKMSEREYQLYLAQIQAKALKDNSNKISGTLWGIFTAELVLGVVAGLIMAASSN